MIDIWKYSSEPPPEPSAGLTRWVEKFNRGWKPNRRIRRMGYETRCEFFGVYLWEYNNAIYPLLKGAIL